MERFLIPVILCELGCEHDFDASGLPIRATVPNSNGVYGLSTASATIPEQKPE
jgi:hypothetical protein